MPNDVCLTRIVDRMLLDGKSDLYLAAALTIFVPGHWGLQITFSPIRRIWPFWYLLITAFSIPSLTFRTAEQEKTRSRNSLTPCTNASKEGTERIELTMAQSSTESLWEASKQKQAGMA